MRVFLLPVLMSKQLPYYQFEVAEYMAGEIMLCSLEAQGLFSIIKCLYWQRDCNLNVDKVLKRYSRPDLIDELKEERCIKVDESGAITISFLYEQHQRLTERRSKLSQAGRKGGKHKKQATLKPPLSEVEATSKHIEEKRREENKEVDSVPDTNQATPSKMDLFLTWYNETRKEYLPKSRGITAWTDKAKRNFKKTKGKGYTTGDIKHGIRSAFEDPHHKESKWHYVTLEFITREDILQRYVNTEGASREKEYTEMTPAEKAAKYID